LTTIDVTPEIVTRGLGAFDELEFLGRGTFGTTYRAVRDDREVALKVIHNLDMPAYLWEREVASLQQVEHPNVVGLHETGRFHADGHELLFLACEYISGGSVESWVARGETPEPDSLRMFLSGMLAGISEIHDLGIIHRDIKPANVGLRDGDWGKPVLLDFGLAKVLGMSTHTGIGQMVGTTMYMAPEQLRGRPARVRSDLFAVGLVTYEAGTGSHPFVDGDVQTVQQLHDRIVAGPPADPRGSYDWPDDVATVVLRILSAEPHERLSVARALRDLEDH
jgi:eukaryotic-like serine/threonine-protein kinase